MSPPPLTLPESPEFWRQLGEWIACGRPLTEQERAERMAVCAAQRTPRQASLMLTAPTIGV